MGRVTVYTDGATRPTNPGHSGYGAVVYRDEVEVESACGYLGAVVTSNQAEYCALAVGLDLAQQHRRAGDVVVVYSDSLLAVNQVNGVWAQHSRTLRKLWDRVKVKLEAFYEAGIDVQIEHVNGHRGIVGNEEADRLAGLAVTERREAPREILELLEAVRVERQERRGYEQLADNTLTWLADQGIRVFRAPRVTDKYCRTVLHEANDLGARMLLYQPSAVAVFPFRGTCLLAFETRYLIGPWERAQRVMLTDAWEALAHWQTRGATVLVVHQPYGVGRWKTEADMRWGPGTEVVPAVVAPLDSIRVANVEEPPAGWAPVVRLMASWVPLVQFVRELRRG